MIESLQNDKIKYLARLTADNRFRKKSEVFVVEGQQENQRAIQFEYEALEFFICKELFKDAFDVKKHYEVSEKVYEKIAYRGSSEGIIGIYKTKDSDIKEFKPRENASFIVVEGIEKPGNLGAILRSCEAFGIDALIVCDGKTDFYNPNVIRSSVGCLFGMQVFSCSNEDANEFFKKHNINVFSTYMSETSKDIDEVDLKKSSAIIFGTEHSGISSFWLEKSENILIPMQGTIDSLNLSNAVAISCYEWARQKKSV